jgi:hypothetical protein
MPLCNIKYIYTVFYLMTWKFMFFLNNVFVLFLT